MTQLQVTPTVADLPPSCKLVSLVVKQEAPVTQAEIRARTLLADSTVRTALQRLEELGLVAKHAQPGDAGTNKYVWTENDESTR